MCVKEYKALWPAGLPDRSHWDHGEERKAKPMGSAPADLSHLPDWQPHLAVGITGHRENNPTLSANRAEVVKTLNAIFDTIGQLTKRHCPGRTEIRLYNLLAEGVDHIASDAALARDWSLIAPLPFGRQLNLAINAEPDAVEDARAILSGGEVSNPEAAARASKIQALADKAQLFELADRDPELQTMFEDMLGHPDDRERAQRFDAHCSDKVAAAGRVMIERVDLLIAVWDRKDSHHRGGTGHTMMAALKLGAPVLLVDPANPSNWSIISRPEELGASQRSPSMRLESIISGVFSLKSEALLPLENGEVESTKGSASGFYRWIEDLFGGSEAIPINPIASSKAGGTESASIIAAFEATDRISTRLSEAYRSSMCINFVLAALAVIVGVLYLPLGLNEAKWVFAGIELILLGAILAVTIIGRRRRWHQEWFETRRVAEYLRHAPSLVALGVSRPIGRWPRGTRREWPEQFVRHCLRNTGLPQIRLDQGYLQSVLSETLAPHVVGQRDYHRAKAMKLSRVHHGLDRAAQACFFVGVLSVAAYLGLKLASVIGLVPTAWASSSSMVFTFLGVAFPTLGANLAGIRFFGDFERFAAISRIATERLEDIGSRIDLLLADRTATLSYREVTDLIRDMDEAVVEEIASWQAVFGAKHLELPA